MAKTPRNERDKGMGTRNSCLSPPDGIKLLSEVNLKNYSTWRIGGGAEWLGEPSSHKELQALIAWAYRNGIPLQIIGAGSNLLISDTGLEGLVICTKKLCGSKIDPKHGFIEASAGEPIPSLSRKAAKAGLSGLEWSIGIPGTIGGGATMNAGAQGGSISEILESVVVVSKNNPEPFQLTRKELNYGYRSSRLQDESLFVISTKLKLSTGSKPDDLLQKTYQNLHHRTSTQPYQFPSCGSVFRNPEPLKAGKLIEDLGLKGHRVGDAEISKMHANFIINKGNAKAEEISQVIQIIQSKVKKAHGLRLYTEVKKVGF